MFQKSTVLVTVPVYDTHMQCRSLCHTWEVPKIATGLSTLPHFAGDSRILSISPSLQHEIPSLPHREEEELQIKKKHISLAFLVPEILALKVEVQFYSKFTCFNTKSP